MVQGIDKPLTPKEQCKDDYRKFSKVKNRLHEAAWRFLRNVKLKKRIPKADHDEAERIVNLIVGDWQKVRPHAIRKMGVDDPFAQATETFNPSHWLDVDATTLHSALVECGERFKTVRGIYKRLRPDEQKELFPDGLKP